MRQRILHDLNKLFLLTFPVALVGTWRADYGMIFPFKTEIASFIAYSLVIYGFNERYKQLKSANPDKNSWKKSSSWVLLGIMLYTLHPAALLIALIITHFYPPSLPKPGISILKYESLGWSYSAFYIITIDLLREYTVWHRFVMNPLPISLFIGMVILNSWINVRSSRV